MESALGWPSHSHYTLTTKWQANSSIDLDEENSSSISKGSLLGLLFLPTGAISRRSSNDNFALTAGLDFLVVAVPTADLCQALPRNPKALAKWHGYTRVLDALTAV